MRYDFDIVTLHNAQNYGAVLQAYAMKTHLETLGYKAGIYDAEQIPAPVNKSLRSLSINCVLKLLKMLNRRNQKKLTEKFLKFTNENFDLNKSESSKVYISGSDQVWNPIVINPAYYLDFVNKGSIKASYAASIGVSSIPNEKADVYKKYLSSFDYISVREMDAKRELEKIISRTDIRVDIDPTFLLTKEEWSSMADEGEAYNRNEYILLYLLHIPKNINKICHWLKKELNCDLVLIDNGGYLGYKVKHDCILKTVGPQDFLALVRGAKAVITTSFHGTAFSILFEKEFYSIINPAFPSRINNILQHCNISPISDTQTVFERPVIDYKFVGDIILVDRNLSDEYFRKIIKDYEWINNYAG